jgi:hypothetical protein
MDPKPASARPQASGSTSHPTTTTTTVLSKLASLSDGAPQRDDRLALIEDLEVGPIDHKPPFDDPHFEYLEPNSGIRLWYVMLSG